MKTSRVLTLLLALLLCGSRGAAADPPTVAFFTDFEAGIPAGFTAPGAHLDAVQGWGGLGSLQGPFEGSFLRYDLQGIQDTRLVVRSLPSHTHVDVGFLLAVIDSWDGVELLEVLVDGQVRFSHWFQLATGDSSSYAAPAGALLSRGTNLGYSNGSYYGRDRAYDLSLEPAFQSIPHTADSVVVVWRLIATPGGGANFWQGGLDESWAIDHVRISVHGAPGVDAPAAGLGAAMSLDAPSPHPARISGFRLAFSLPTSEPAQVELYDVGGRRIDGRLIAAPVPGPQYVEIGAGTAISPGVHFARLTQGARSRTQRIVLMP